MLRLLAKEVLNAISLINIRAIEGDISLQGVLKSGPGSIFGVGLTRMEILPYLVVFDITWLMFDY